ncbi:MAG TPA: hypothetical protein VGG27_03300 [Magnetospirillaceae bacterium]|jgi:hypothetical protein
MTGRRVLALVGIVALLAPSAEALAKARGCFTKKEQQAEEVVRQGLRMREGGEGCDGAPWYAETKPLWDMVNQQFGAQFAEQTDIRNKAFMREFENDAEHKLSLWNARIVFYFRNYPLSAGYCTTVKKMLTDAPQKGWKDIIKQAHYARDEIRMTYEPCDK